VLGDEQWIISDSDMRLRSVFTYTDTELATGTFSRYAGEVYCLLYVLAPYLSVLYVGTLYLGLRSRQHCRVASTGELSRSCPSPSSLQLAPCTTSRTTDS